MSVCNFCVLEGVRAHAEKASLELVITPDPADGFPDGIAVYAAPANTPEDKTSDWFACWLAKLPDTCVCHDNG